MGMNKVVGTSMLMSASCMAIAAALQLGAATSAYANDKLIELSKSKDNWVMPGRNYDSNNYSEDDQINVSNIKQLKHAWSFSTGELHGHEGAPLVVDGV